MAKKLGNDYRIWLESTTPGTYNEIKGNQDLEYDVSGGTVDTSTKSDFPYGTSSPGLKSISLTAGFIPDLPDANGFTRLETLAKSASVTVIPIQIRKGGAAGADPADVVFECDMYCTARRTGFGQNQAVGVTFTLVNAAVPTVDALA